ncbi:MAG: protein translocase subunit SecF [Candidatus Aquicultorales bacterium]
MKRDFDFMGRMKIWFAISAVLLTLAALGMGVRGLKLGIEFDKGTSFEIAKAKNMTVESVRDEMKRQGLSHAVIQPINRGSQMLIRTKTLSSSEQIKVKDQLAKKFKVDEKAITIQSVGPAWGEEIRQSAYRALFAAIIGLLVYITIRFDFKMAVGAIAAIFHDLSITAGIYALVGREVNPNTIAALLTILGYSLYDTIVVFHRIKENSAGIGKETYTSMVNRSVNQVFVRSINTAVTTMITVTAILLLGGETLKDFAFALFVGLAASSYSSIFVATPIMTLLKELEAANKTLRRKYGRQEKAARELATAAAK